MEISTPLLPLRRRHTAPDDFGKYCAFETMGLTSSNVRPLVEIWTLK